MRNLFQRQYRPTFWQMAVVILFTAIFYLSLNIDAHNREELPISILPAANSKGVVKFKLFSPTLASYMVLQIPQQGWKQEKVENCCVTYTAQKAAPAFKVTAGAEGALVNFEKGPHAGAIDLIYSDGKTIHYDLKAPEVSTFILRIGSAHSDLPPPLRQQYSLLTHLALLSSIIAVFTSLAFVHNRQQLAAAGSAIAAKISPVTWAFMAAPLLASTVTFFFFYPANAAYDSGLQWTEAASSATELNLAIGPFTTLFMRAFAALSNSPAPLIVFQMVLAAIGVSLILSELQHRGVSKRVAMLTSVAIAIAPQYGVFFTYLSKDALCGMALLYFTWSVLWVCRLGLQKKLTWLACFALAFSGFLSGAFRVNVLPAIAAVIICVALYLAFKKIRLKAVVLVVAYVVLVVALPKTLIYLNKQSSSTETAAPEINAFPLGLLWEYHILHLFSAAVDSGLPLDKEDTALFYKLAPEIAWKQYRCYMTDTTTDVVLANRLMPQDQVVGFLSKNQIEMAHALVRIVQKQPAILLHRQACMTKILWSIGYKQVPFLAPLTIGYDSVPDSFLALAGKNRPLGFRHFKRGVLAYQQYSQQPKNFWFFWKPALPLILASFAVVLGWTRRRDAGTVLAYATVVFGIGALAIVIPFPAYRYAYPFVLIVCLLAASLFAKPVVLEKQEGLS